MKTNHLHFNNSSSSKQSLAEFSQQVYNEIVARGGTFTISVDDGDGDVYKYTISVDCERVENIKTPNQ